MAPTDTQAGCETIIKADLEKQKIWVGLRRDHLAVVVKCGEPGVENWLLAAPTPKADQE